MFVWNPSYIAQDHSYAQELSMHSVSTIQCELICFPGGHFADHVIITIKRMAPMGVPNVYGLDGLHRN